MDSLWQAGRIPEKAPVAWEVCSVFKIVWLGDVNHFESGSTDLVTAIRKKIGTDRYTIQGYLAR